MISSSILSICTQAINRNNINKNLLFQDKTRLWDINGNCPKIGFIPIPLTIFHEEIILFHRKRFQNHPRNGDETRRNDDVNNSLPPTHIRSRFQLFILV